MQVTGQDHPHTAKGLTAVAVHLQHLVNGLKHVRADHGYLVDDHGLDGLDQTLGAHLLDIGAVQKTRGKLEEGMDGLPARIDGSEPCRGQDDGLVACALQHFFQERCLARARAAGEEDVAPRGQQLLHQRCIDRRFAIGVRGRDIDDQGGIPVAACSRKVSCAMLRGCGQMGGERVKTSYFGNTTCSVGLYGCQPS